MIVDLPEHYRQEDVLSFHGRDAMGVSETVDGDSLRKGIVWRGTPGCLTLSCAKGRVAADLHLDGRKRPADEAGLREMVHRMLGLTQPVEQFESAYRGHSQIGRLIARHPGLRLPVAASPFEALTWAVTGQQISVGAAVSIRRKLIRGAGAAHSSGLLCYPDAAAVSVLSEDDLRSAGFSQTKARTVLEISRRVTDGRLPLEDWLTGADMKLVGERLREVPGIGPWTVSYSLLRGYGWLDGSLHGDVAVRRGLQSLLGSAEKIDEKAAERWLAAFRPWRALVGAHLWAWTSVQA